MLKRVVCRVLNLFVIMLHLQLISSQLPAEQVSTMIRTYEIIQNDTGSSFVWNAVLKTSNPCSWEGVGCNPDNSSINTISFKSFSISTSEFLPFLCNIATLESLDVSDNRLSSIPEGFFTSCGGISGLKLLDFSWNWLNGSVPTFNNEFRMLEKLDFSVNSLSGEISLQLDGLNSLKILDLGWNKFTGMIPTNLGKMNLFEVLVFSANAFTGEIPIEITKHKNLSVIDFSGNQLSGIIPGELGDLTWLKTLDLSDNNLIGGIPASLSNITTLESFAVDYNNLNGTIPCGITWHLKKLSLKYNNLTGMMPSDLLSGPHLLTVYLSFNHLEGPIPTINSTTLLELYLELDNNILIGSLPPFLGNLTNLQVLSLEFNDFVGAIPPEISQLNQMEKLNIGGNSLNGSIPWWISRMQNLRRLDLQGNNLRGPIPDSFGNLSSLIQLHLGNNLLFEVPIQVSLSRLQNLEVLGMQGNNLRGPIPNSFGNLSHLSELQLGNNQLNGKIPDSLSGLKSLQVLDLQSNNLNGPITHSIGNLSRLTELQLGNNRLSWKISGMPQTLETALNLSCNRLVGRIPFSLSTLWSLKVLDLSNNRLSGEIPNLLTDLSSLTQLLLMNNELSGIVPKFGDNVEVDTSGNKDLLYPKENPTPAIIPHTKTKSSLIDSDMVIFVASGFPDGLVISVIAIFISRRYNSIHGNLSTPNIIHSSNVDFKKAMETVADHSNITLKTAFSTFYKVVIPSSGTTYLVKEINHSRKIFQFPRHKELVEELEALGSLSNPNVMIPVAYVLTVRRAYLFYDFVRGTLYDILHHRMGNKLDWPSRYNIVVGVSKALVPSFSSIFCSRSILLKSLDQPQISDIELCKLIHPSKTRGSMFTDGYVPPEYGCTKRVTAVGNVYSFGVVLLELLTGKPAVSEGTELAKLVLSSSSKWDQILDSNVSEIETSIVVRDQMLVVLEVALACISISPEMRPNAVSVVQMLLNKSKVEWGLSLHQLE